MRRVCVDQRLYCIVWKHRRELETPSKDGKPTNLMVGLWNLTTQSTHHRVLHRFYCHEASTTFRMTSHTYGPSANTLQITEKNIGWIPN